MIHSASFAATGSDIAAAACVASAGLRLRTSSMTFSSTSLSDCGVDDVAAIAAGAGGFRAAGEGSAACWRVAGWIAGAGVAASSETGLAATVVFGTRLRAIGRGFGNGIFGFAAKASAAQNADNPTTSVRLAPNAVHRIAVARANGVTVIFPGESGNRGRPTSISLKLWTKY